MMYVNIYKKEDEFLVAACDREILGKKFTEGDICLNVSRGFYGGRHEPVEKLKDLLSNASIANLTGNRVVEHAIVLGFIEEEHVLRVEGIKHAQFVLI